MALVEKTRLDRSIRQRLPRVDKLLHPVEATQGEITVRAGAEEHSKVIRQAPAIPPGAVGEVVQRNRPIHKGRATAVITMTNEAGITVLKAETNGVLPDVKGREILTQMLSEGDPTNGVAALEG